MADALIAPATVSVDFDREATLLWGPRSTGPDNDDIARGRGPQTPTPVVFYTPCGINAFVDLYPRQKLCARPNGTWPGFRSETLSDVVFAIVRKASARWEARSQVSPRRGVHVQSLSFVSVSPPIRGRDTRSDAVGVGLGRGHRQAVCVHAVHMSCIRFSLHQILPVVMVSSIGSCGSE